MVHHIGIGVVGAALLAAILAPSACNPLKSKEETPPPAVREAVRIDEQIQETPMAFTYLYHMTFHPP